MDPFAGGLVYVRFPCGREADIPAGDLHPTIKVEVAAAHESLSGTAPPSCPQEPPAAAGKLRRRT